MRHIGLTAFAACVLFAVGTVAPQPAQATPASTLLSAVTSTDLLQAAAYECRPIWRCGRYGCGWRQVCYWTPRPIFRPRFFGPRRRYWY